MNFQKKSISAQDEPKAKNSESLLKRVLRHLPRKRQEPMPKWKKYLVGGVAAGGTLLILWIFWTIYVFFSHFSLGEVLMLFGNLDKDENNRTQILLLGSGSETHDSPELTDTIIVASLNHDDKTISMLSIPRDLWINTGNGYGSRINRIYQDNIDKYGREGAMQILEETIEDIIGQEIQYYARVDFDVFKDVVDAIGGVDVTLDYKLCDEEYPDEFLKGYDPFCIDAGEQHVDGDMALRLARSRHGYYLDENADVVAWSSDFDRAARQQQIISSIKSQLTSSSTLTSPSKLKGLWDSYYSNVETNMGFREMWSLACFGVDLQSNGIAQVVLNYSEVEDTVGSFLYPPERSLYGGASVLRPVGDSFTKIRKFVKFFFEHGNFFNEKPRIEILNGTRTPGLAADFADDLVLYGFDVVRLGNTDSDVVRNRTAIIFPSDETEFSATQTIIRSFVPGVISHRGENYSDDEIDITIELGTDSINYEN